MPGQNSCQHKLLPLKNTSNKMKKRSFLAFFLVDPNVKIPDTSMIKPQNEYIGEKTLNLNMHNLMEERKKIKVKLNEKLSGLFDALKDINSKLWVIEDDKRLCEKNSDFGEKFIKLSRDIHFLNDKRASIKLEINNQTGSKIKEIKEYTSY